MYYKYYITKTTVHNVKIQLKEKFTTVLKKKQIFFRHQSDSEFSKTSRNSSHIHTFVIIYI